MRARTTTRTVNGADSRAPETASGSRPTWTSRPASLTHANRPAKSSCMPARSFPFSASSDCPRKTLFGTSLPDSLLVAVLFAGAPLVGRSAIVSCGCCPSLARSVTKTATVTAAPRANPTGPAPGATARRRGRREVEEGVVADGLTDPMAEALVNCLGRRSAAQPIAAAGHPADRDAGLSWLSAFACCRVGFSLPFEFEAG